MADHHFKTIDEYIAAQPEAAKVALTRVREAIRAAIPHAAEAISYNIPTFKLGGKSVIHFAGWKEHYSIYPASAGLVSAFAEDLAPYHVNKGTIRFPLAKPVSMELIGRLAAFRARETCWPDRVE